MTRFQTITEKHQGVTIYVLRDLQTGACARIAPALGGNCLELKLPAAPGAEPMAVIDDLKFLSQVKEQPSRYGIPVLFPWPSGIPGGIFKFRDRTYHLNEEGVTRTAHHGFVNRASWKVLRSDCDNTGAWLTCDIAAKDCGEAGARFPFPFTLQITWRLTPERFIMQMEARNTGSEPMPAGLGLHPYFSIPFGPKGSRQECRLAATVVRQWNLDKTVGVKAGGSAPDQVFLPGMEFDPTTANGKPLDSVKFNHVLKRRLMLLKKPALQWLTPRMMLS